MESLVRLVSENSELTYPTERLKAVANDETDNRVIECAVTARADFVVTGDQKHLLKLGRFGSIVILSPANLALKLPPA